MIVWCGVVWCGLVVVVDVFVMSGWVVRGGGGGSGCAAYISETPHVNVQVDGNTATR